MPPIRTQLFAAFSYGYIFLPSDVAVSIVAGIVLADGDSIRFYQAPMQPFVEERHSILDLSVVR